MTSKFTSCITKKLAATVIIIYTGVVASAENKDDFSTFFTEENTQYKSEPVTTDAGWILNNFMVKDIALDGIFAPTLTGNADAPGTITSPVLTNGIGTLSFNYMCYYSDKTVDLTIRILKNNVEVDTLNFFHNQIEQKSPYTYSRANIDIEGEVTFEIVNNSPSNQAKNLIDRVSIWNITWTDFPEETEIETTPEYPVVDKTYTYDQPIEFDAPEGVHILYCFNGIPDHTNIYDGPAFAAARVVQSDPGYIEGVTYNHTTHPLIFRNEPISVNYVSYEEGKQPSAVKTLEIGANGSTTDLASITVIDTAHPAEYFDLSGRRVMNPSTGIFLRRQGSTITKIIK